MENEELLRGFNLLLEYQAAEIANSDRLLELASELQNFIDNSPYKPAYNGSILDIIGGISETLTSQVISNILKYQDEDKRYSLLKSFINRFLRKDIEIVNPEVTAEKERLDVAVKDTNYSIVIENKLRDAPFQRNQLARYIARLKSKYDEENIYLVILPQFSDTPIRTSAGRLPFDWYNNNEDRKCATGRFECWCDFPKMVLEREQMDWCLKCDKNILERIRKNTVKLHDDFSEWLIEESMSLPQKQWPLKSCMLQFAYYLKGLYNTRFSNKLNMAIIEFLREKVLPNGSSMDKWEAIDETISELDRLKKSIEGLRREVAISFIKEWEKSLKKDFPNLVSNTDKNGEYSFGLLFEGIWIGCWAGVIENNNRPYWGFYSPNNADEAQIKMIKRILDQCNMDYEVSPEDSYKAWDETFEGDIICKNLYRAALSLGYK